MAPVLPSTLVGVGGKYMAVAASAIAAGAVVISPGPTRLCKVIVNTALTSAQAISFFDNASAGSGTTVFTTAAAAAAGTVYDVQIPCGLGLTIGQNASLAAGAIVVTFE